jgi:hypothetical protein
VNNNAISLETVSLNKIRIYDVLECRHPRFFRTDFVFYKLWKKPVNLEQGKRILGTENVKFPCLRYYLKFCYSDQSRGRQ